jgi:hypothetical protein
MPVTRIGFSPTAMFMVFSSAYAPRRRWPEAALVTCNLPVAVAIAVTVL